MATFRVERKGYCYVIKMKYETYTEYVNIEKIVLI